MTRNEFLLFLMVTFIVVMIWVVSDIIHTRKNVKISPDLEQVSQEIIPTFDQKTLDQIKNLP